MCCHLPAGWSHQRALALQGAGAEPEGLSAVVSQQLNRSRDNPEEVLDAWQPVCFRSPWEPSALISDGDT